jgi:hypothetical protein
MDYHARVETLLATARAFGGSLAEAPIVVNLVGSADAAFSARAAAAGAEVRVVPPVADGPVHANKLRMLELAGREDFDVLLAVDCDIAVADDPAPLLPRDAIGVVPADVDPLSERQWQALHRGVGVTPRGRQLRASASGRPLYPYFNSGVVSVPREHCAALQAGWTQALRDLEQLWQREPTLLAPKQRFFTDQLALAVALWRGLPWRAVSPALNFPTHVPVQRSVVEGVRPALLHYHFEVDAAGLLLRPRSPVAAEATERVNRYLAAQRGLPYGGLHGRSRVDSARRLLHRARARWTGAAGAIAP